MVIVSGLLVARGCLSHVYSKSYTRGKCYHLLVVSIMSADERITTSSEIVT